MKYNYCTIFDKGFLNRGLALYHSVKRHHKAPFRHFILCVDETTYDVLTALKLEYVTPIRMRDFEASDPRILEAKGNRDFLEYMWTLSSVFTSYILKKYPDCDYVTYLDGDLYFFDSPEVAFEALGNDATLIIPHNLPPWKREKEESVGKYNVGMVIFKNDVDGRACLSWWTDECLLWCYIKPEPGKFGDQKYLDYFEEKFNGVFVWWHKGACLAPWNIRNFRGKIHEEDGRVMVDDEPLIFFHFSSFRLYWPHSRFLPDGPLNNYTRPTPEKKLIYRHYFDALYAAMNEARTIEPEFTFGTLPRPSTMTQIKEIVVPRVIGTIKDIVRPILRRNTAV